MQGRTSNFRWALVFAVAVIVAGCGKDERSVPGVYIDESKSVLMKDLSPRDVIVRVNGINVTKGDFLVRRSLTEKVYRLRNKIDLSVKSKKAKSYIREMEKSIPDEYIRHELFRQAADAEGIIVPETRMKAEFKKFLNYIGRPKDSMDKVISLIGQEEGRVLVDFMRDGIRSEILRDRLATNGYYTVTDEMVSNHLERISEWNKNAKRLNEKSRAKALAFREKVLKGEDFVELGKKTAQIRPDYVEKWDFFQLSELTDDVSQFREWLKTANKGDLSDPIDLDDGIAIIKVIDKWSEPQGASAEPVDEFELSRCTFKAYQYAIEETVDEVREHFKRDLKSSLMAQLGNKLWKSAVIEFPNGCDFFGEVEQNSEKTDGAEVVSSNSLEKTDLPITETKIKSEVSQ